jgi:hypothetical protein
MPVATLLSAALTAMKKAQSLLEVRVKYSWRILTPSLTMLAMFLLMPAAHAQMSKVKTVWVILMENQLPPPSSALLRLSKPSLFCLKNSGRSFFEARVRKGGKSFELQVDKDHARTK